MRVSFGGNLLVGTTTDTGERLQVSGNIRTNSGYIQIRNSSNPSLYINNGSAQWQQFVNSGNHLVFSDAINNVLTLGYNGTASYFQGGNVLIGTTTDNGAKLQVNGSTFINGFTSNALTNHGERFIPLGGPNSSFSFNVATQFPSLAISGNVLGVRMFLTIFGSGGSVYSAIATISRNAGGTWSAYGLTCITSTASLLQSITGSGTTITINTNSGSYVGLTATAIIQ
jgi:hypothetical protein